MLDRYDKIEILAFSNGYDKCRDLLIEEMSELTKALMKQKRLTSEEVKKDFFLQAETNANVYEEWADVYITLFELARFFNCTKLDQFIECKIERTLKHEKSKL